MKSFNKKGEYYLSKQYNITSSLIIANLKEIIKYMLLQKPEMVYVDDYDLLEYINNGIIITDTTIKNFFSDIKVSKKYIKKFFISGMLDAIFIRKELVMDRYRNIKFERYYLKKESI